MTHIVPLSTAIYSRRLAVPLPRYAQIVDYAEPAFFGVNHPDNDRYQCREIWSHDQRIAVYRALQEAQAELERTAEFPLLPTWIVAERHNMSSIQVLNYGKLLAVGQQATSIISSGEVCNHANDPVIITIAGMTFTDVNEVHIYHPGTDVEIYPSSISIAGGVLTILIPRVRMVKIALENTPVGGLDYATTTNFEATVDIIREYLSPTLPAVEFISFGCETGCDCPTETKTNGCAYIRNQKTSIVQTGTTGCVCISGMTRFADIYYQAGLTELDAAAEDIIVRLAHARMPNEPCGCNFLKGRWNEDQKVPDILTAERENCPYGLSQGAWQAYVFALSMRQIRMGVL